MNTKDSKNKHPKHRILCAEDKAEDQMVLTLVLEKLGYSADFVHTGEGTVKKIMSNQYDFLFMDLELKGMNGFEAAKYIRSHEAKNNQKPLHITAITGYTSPEVLQRSLESGINGFITKPIEYQDISNVINHTPTDLN